MSGYDDERVIALLKDGVPPAPEDNPDRLTAVRAVAGRQRTQVWLQALGSGVAVLLLVGLVAAVARPGGGSVRPTSNPIKSVLETLRDAKSVAFETSAKFAGAPELDSHYEGAYSRAGDAWFKGSGRLPTLFWGTGKDEDFEVRVVEGVMYRRAFASDPVPAGKLWIREYGETAELVTFDPTRYARLIADFVSEPRHVGSGSVRGVETARYEADVRIPLQSTSMRITFQLDAQGRLRSIAGDVPLAWLGRGLMDLEFGEDSSSSRVMLGTADAKIHIEIGLFDYDVPVAVAAPPAAEVVAADEIEDRLRDRQEVAEEMFDSCMESYGPTPTQAQFDRCLRVYERISPPGTKCTGRVSPDGGVSRECSSGSHSSTTHSGVETSVQPVPATATPGGAVMASLAPMPAPSPSR